MNEDVSFDKGEVMLRFCRKFPLLFSLTGLLVLLLVLVLGLWVLQSLGLLPPENSIPLSAFDARILYNLANAIPFTVAFGVFLYFFGIPMMLVEEGNKNKAQRAP